MILRKFDEEMFEMSNFDISNVLFDWEYYYKQYKKVLCFLACNENVMGIRFMSFLFVFRHTVELFLKKQMSIQKTTHSLNELFDEVEGLPDDFLIQLNVLRCNGDGSDFRYITDKAGMPYFKGEVLPVLKPLEYFFRLSNTDVELVDKPRGKFDIQTSSLCTMGHVSTDYDESMCLILQGIKENRLSIDDVYLPLLYLVRHSIELSLKQNLLNAGQKYLTSKSILKIKNEHSICKLFNKFETVINIAISNILDSTEFKQDTEKHHRSLGELKDIIHDIESNSYYFRFPMDRYGQSYNLNIDGNKLVKILKLRERIDAYVTFAVPLLQEYGYLDYDD